MMGKKTLPKVFRVYAKYKKDTTKGGSGYDLFAAREEIFKEFDAWENLVKPKILNVWYDYKTLMYANGIPYWELTVLYQTASKEKLENFEDIIRRFKEFVDWDIVDEKCVEKLTSIFVGFLRHGSMDKLRREWLSYARGYKHKRTVQ